jgi:hypothetical protein
MSKGASMVAMVFGLLALSSGIADGETQAERATAPSAALAAALQTDSDVDALMRAKTPTILVTSSAPRPHIGNELSHSTFAEMSIEVLIPPPALGDSVGLGTSNALRPLEVAIATPLSNFDLDVGFAKRGMSSETPGAYVSGGGSEVRIGQGLVQSGGDDVDHHGWYVFAASDGRALTWTPNNDPSSADRGLRLENTVEIGDLQAGFAMSSGRMKTSLSVVKRSVKTWVGPYAAKADDSFAGLTWSWKR